MLSRRSLPFFVVLLVLAGLLAPTTANAFVLQDTATVDAKEPDRRWLNNPFKQSVTAVESVPDEVTLDVGELPNTPRVWRNLLTSADTSIKMGLYYYTSRDDSKLAEIGSLLEQKADEGVRVDVVSDSTFFGKYPDDLTALAGHPNVNVRILNLDDRTGGVMHAKYFVVDGTSYYAGSANFSWKSLEHNREVGLAGTDTGLADQMTDVFEVDWKLAGRSDTHWKDVREELATTAPDKTTEDTPPWRTEENFSAVTASPPSLTPGTVRSDLSTLVQLIGSAEDEVLVDVFQYGLTSPYSEENLHELDTALRRASLRGVNVNVLVSDWSLSEGQRAYLESLDALPKVTVRAIGFPTHSSGYLSYARVSHPKMLVVDGNYAWVGSANWQPGYFSQSRNLGLVTNEDHVAEDLKKFFLTAWTSEHATELTGATETEKPSVPYHW